MGWIFVAILAGAIMAGLYFSQRVFAAFPGNHRRHPADRRGRLRMAGQPGYGWKPS